MPHHLRWQVRASVSTSQPELLPESSREFTTYIEVYPNPNPSWKSNNDNIDNIDTVSAENTRLSIAGPLTSMFIVMLIELHRCTAMTPNADNLDQCRSQSHQQLQNAHIYQLRKVLIGESTSRNIRVAELVNTSSHHVFGP